MAVIDCLEDPDDTLKLKTLELLVTMTKANNVQVCVGDFCRVWGCACLRCVACARWHGRA
jgi:AP-4 complex subunit epsilon-1